MVVTVYGTVSLWAFTGGVGVLVLFTPSVLSSVYSEFVTAWWIYILTIYVLLAIAVTGVVFKRYEFQVNSWKQFVAGRYKMRKCEYRGSK